MQRKSQTIFVGLRIPEGLLKKIDEDIEKSAEFASRSDYLITAIRFYQEERRKIQEEKSRTEEPDYIAAHQENLPNKLKN